MAFLISERLISERLEGTEEHKTPISQASAPLQLAAMFSSFLLPIGWLWALGHVFFNVFGYSVTFDEEGR